MISKYWSVEKKKDEEVLYIVGINNNTAIAFEVSRQKEKKSGKECLRIEAFYQGQAYGTVKCKISNLTEELRVLGDIGIQLERIQRMELENIIKGSYYDIEPIFVEYIISELSEEIIEDVAKYFANYIKDYEVKKSKGFYNILVKDFKEELEDTDFRAYKITDIKYGLREGNYIQCNANRTDYAIKENGKVQKYISFFANKMDELMTCEE